MYQCFKQHFSRNMIKNKILKTMPRKINVYLYTHMTWFFHIIPNIYTIITLYNVEISLIIHFTKVQ